MALENRMKAQQLDKAMRQLRDELDVVPQRDAITEFIVMASDSTKAKLYDLLVPDQTPRPLNEVLGPVENIGSIPSD